MPIDVHAHYVPPRTLQLLVDRGNYFGVRIHHGPDCQCSLHFTKGPKLRPFFKKLVESPEARTAAMDEMQVTTQVLSCWADMFGPHLRAEQAQAWHQFLNENLARVCDLEPRFKFLASVPLPDAHASSDMLEDAVNRLGAVGAVIPANVNDVNLGDLQLDEFWAKAVELNTGIFIHPVQAVPMKRSAKHGLTQIVQYTSDTTLTVGSMIMSGILDRYPRLRLLLAHGGGAVPYLIGRFDCMHRRMDRVQQEDVAAQTPSYYLQAFYYDTIVHDSDILHWLIRRVSAQRVVLGSDYSFPPADNTPVETVRRARLSSAEAHAILEETRWSYFRISYVRMIFGIRLHDKVPRRLLADVVNTNALVKLDTNCALFATHRVQRDVSLS